MCHGSFLERAAVSVPDLLRDAVVDYSLEAQPYDDLPPFNPSFYGNGSTRTDLLLVDDSVLPPQPSVSGEILAEFIGNSKEVDSTDALEDDEEVLGMSGSLSAWFDCIVKEDALQVSSPTPTNKKGASTTHSKMSSEDNSQYADSAPTKSRKARKSAAKENNNHGEHDSEMDDVAPALIDEKRKRRMSSNRASAQRSRQRKQDRLDELEVLTAQLRLENATLLRKSKLAVQMAKKYETEKNNLAKKVEELMKELKLARCPQPGTPDSDGDRSATSQHMASSGVCDMVEGGLSESAIEVKSKDDMGQKLQLSPCSFPPPSSKSQNGPPLNPFSMKKLEVPVSEEMPQALFQELFDSIDSQNFEIGAVDAVQDIIPQEWLETFAECLSA